MYKKLCQFNFNLNNYSEEFNFELIKKYGWYSASNRGGNLNGVSRDHKYSIHNGFKNLINPYLISHPANCKIIQYFKNNKKNIKNELTIESLVNNINIFNEKYNLRKFNGIIYIKEKDIEKLYRMAV